ncbi:MAG: DUF6607 family protein [Pseudomonadota bacterium]
MAKTTAALAALSAALLLGACTTYDTASPSAQGSSAQTASAQVAQFEQDRQAILAMVGNHAVKFEFTETVSFAPGYEPKDPYVSGANEVVLVVEDAGDFISLQHILVVGGGGQKFAIKHWRQDWRYEPSQVLTFVGGNTWDVRPVSPAEAKGKWSQTVYQVDDSPRYGAVGAWTHGAAVSQWTPPAEWRPLPRRDMTTRDDYHAVDAVNIHAVTPTGWVHEQANLKIALRGEPQALVREIGVNTYDKFNDFESEIATDYWSATQDYWTAVRAAWSAFEVPGTTFGVTLKGETADLYGPLLTYADEIRSGKKSVEVAIAEAETKIAAYTTRTPPPLQERLREPAPAQSD